MRAATLDFMTGTVIPVLLAAERHTGRLDTIQVRLVISFLGWPVVVFAPLVAFDAGGGQSAIDVMRYIAFRGLDRDAWYATSALSMLAGFLSASAVLVGLVVHSIGLVFKDRAFVLWGCGIILASLCVVVLATHPVAAVSMFGALALPHFGWWLTLSYTALTLQLVSWWRSGHPVHKIN